MRGRILLGLALAAVLAAPLVLRPRAASPPAGAAETLVIVTPNVLSIRQETARAFARWHLQKTGRTVRVDWRTPGGTSDITRYLNAEYVAAFRRQWEGVQHQPWSEAIEHGFTDPKQPALPARRAFLASSVGCGIDLFFGGGAYDSIQQAAAGRLVDSGAVRPATVPQTVGGEIYWDAQGRWFGTTLTAFGICYNRDVLRRLGLPEPRRWADLGDPRYRRALAVANPTQSGSVAKAFEMLIQQQMLEEWRRRGLAPEQENAAIAAGWETALQLILRIGANARYFTDASSKITLDVAAGEAAAGMTIDFYGQSQADALRQPDGTSRLGYTNAEGGTDFGADPIGMLRGAPHPELAREFIEWQLSPAGQTLWNARPGTPGGPEHYALRRLPILPLLYEPQFRAGRSDPDVNPWSGEALVYHDRWTGPLFRPIAFLVRVMCVEPHEELTGAWEVLVQHGLPPAALRTMLDVSAVDYAAASGRIRTALGTGKLAEAQLARELSDHFRAQYEAARRQALE